MKLQFPDAVRTYTALFPDVAAGTLAIDFVTHGDEGVAGPWASAAHPVTRSRCAVREAPRPDPTADWHLLAGDESALPAITAALEELPAEAVARVVVLVEDTGHEPSLPLPEGAELTVLHRATKAEGQSLASAVRALEWLPGRVHAFVHGEAAEVMHDIRPYLLKERGLDRDQVSISGYWRRGRSEEGFRQWKAEPRRGGRERLAVSGAVEAVQQQEEQHDPEHREQQRHAHADPDCPALAGGVTGQPRNR